MGMSKQIGSKQVDVSDGVLSVDGVVVGSVMQDLKHGYHPAICITVNNEKHWMEMDAVQPDLSGLFAEIEKIIA